MPWFVWMGFLTAPVPVGVAWALASDAPDNPNGIEAVLVAGGIWVFVAYHLRHHLEDRTPSRWVRWWVGLAVVLPLLVLFVGSLRHDPGVMRLVAARQRESKKPAADGGAAAAPARRAFTWAESKELVARVRPLAWDFVVKLFTSLPAAWWFAAFGVGLWRGK